MPIQLTWYIDQHVITLQSSGTVTGAELVEADQKMLEMLNSSPASTIHLLMDDRHLEVQPTLADFSKLRFLQDTRLGWIIGVGTRKEHRLIGSFLSQRHNLDVRYLDTLTEAYDFLYEIDSTLPDPFSNLDNLR